jgi:hypothetical protein
MAPTIRIDDEVYQWLQSRAIPFEDNPNSVLRRIAGLDRKIPREQSAKPAVRSTAGTSPAMRQRESAIDREIDDKRMGMRAGRRPPLARGADLIRRWRIPARQARFHRDGSWYERFDRFPAAYCDRNGYVLFGSADDLRTTPGIRIEPSGQVWVPGGISGVAGYCKTDDPIVDPDSPEQT